MTTATTTTKGMYIDGQWRDADSGRTLGVINPATEDVVRRRRIRRPGRGPPGAGSGRQGDARLDEAHGLRSREDPQKDRRTDARAGRRHRPHADDGAGQAARRGQGGGPALGRHVRMVRGGGQAGLWPDHPPLATPRKRHYDDQAPRRRGRHDHARGTSPIALPSRKIAPALAVGCTVVSKPAEPNAARPHPDVRVPGRRGFAGGRRQSRDGPGAGSCRRVVRQSDLSARSASPARPRSARN